MLPKRDRSVSVFDIVIIVPALLIFATADHGAGGVLAAEQPPPFGLSDWGADHVGKPLPAYVTGDECLFCHRETGFQWPRNRHQLTIRPARDDPAARLLRQLPDGESLASEIQYVMGSRRVTRFLRRAPEYGKLETLSAQVIDGKVIAVADAKQVGEPGQRGASNGSGRIEWDRTAFEARCAGCHATAVDTQTRAFSALSLDCFTCHGDVTLDHTGNVRRVLLSTENREPRQVISICGQCHLRGGKSKSSGLPFPNTFVAGDNLFRDFQVDLSDTAIRKMPQLDQHLYWNVRDAASSARSTVTCLTCHEVHNQSTEKHQMLEFTAICSSCHVSGTNLSRLLPSLLASGRQEQTHSRVCDY